MRWPGRPAQRYAHRSSHFDLPVPPLLEDALGCAAIRPPYALGRNLYDGTDWPWLIAGSYNAHAIVTPQSIVVTTRAASSRSLGPGTERPLDARSSAKTMGAMRRWYR